MRKDVFNLLFVLYNYLASRNSLCGGGIAQNYITHNSPLALLLKCATAHAQQRDPSESFTDTSSLLIPSF